MTKTSKKVKWSADDIPDQRGRVVIITGSTSGLGKEAARVLAAKGAAVVMAVRNTAKGEDVAAALRAASPDAEVVVMALDLASLASVKSFADAFAAEYGRLDVLINNAGVMMCPYAQTEDGFEIQMGTNHLGHFALTGRLLPLLRATEGSRIVATSSFGHAMGNIDFTDMNWEKRPYNTNRAYGDSKLANLYFTYAFARRYKDDPQAPTAVAAHPGATATELARHSPGIRFFNRFIAQKVEIGTLPTLMAATAPDVAAGDYYGPEGFMGIRGYPAKVESNARSHDVALATKLWEASVAMTGVDF
jgi:NAD(P)-dependent dehydrogenase (short-subunit alcohol dehydrogenase family)